MIGGHRAAAVALLGVCVAAWIVIPGQMAAQSRSVEVKTVQEVRPITPEPPLAERGPGVPPGASSVVDPPVPVVAVRVRVPSTATAGQELTYHIYVENTSRATAHRVAVRASLPTNAKFKQATPKPDQEQPELHWTLGTMEAGASKDITLIVEPDGKGEVSTTARVSFEHGQSVITHLNKPSLRIQKRGPKEAAVNSPLKYTLDLVNDGSAVAEGILVNDTLPPELTFSTSNPPTKGDNPLRWEFPSLAPGAKQHIEYSVIPTKEGSWTNNVKVTAKGDLSAESKWTVVVGQPKLSIAKTGPKLDVPGHSLVYTIAVKNMGNIAVSNVELLDLIPQDKHPQTGQPLVDFLSATQGGRYDRPDVRWRFASLPAGESRSVQLTLRVNQPGKLNNIAEVRADQMPYEKGQWLTIIVDPSKRLTVDIDKPRELRDVGEEVVYVVRVINSHATQPIEGVALTVSATENVSFGEVRGATNGKKDPLKPSITFESLPKLQAGEIREFAIPIKLLQKGDVKFTASADVNPPLPGFPLRIEDPPLKK